MNKDKRDRLVLVKIIHYCKSVSRAADRFGSGAEALEQDEDYRDSVAMKILQIGELTTHLSDGFKEKHSEIPWQRIKDMRNIAAHGYHKFDTERMWATMTERIPALLEYCNRVIETDISKEVSSPEPEQGFEHEMRL